MTFARSAETSKVREIPHLWIPMSDGIRLAARMWLPEDANERPVPAVLEYIPYRKRDGTAYVDEQTHPLMASHGYACLRVDIRGSGESEGHLLDEYLRQEQDDAVEVIAWIRRQEWCTGSIGMMGMSWGGFNSLQVAARQPEGLKAIVTAYSTVDRFADDVHFKGGNLVLKSIAWAATMMSYLSTPPDLKLVGEGWLQAWLERLDKVPLLVENWLSHQSRDDYWRHGSVCEDYDSIKAAVYCVGGWGDAYKNNISKMLANLSCPTKALIGPWIHCYPHLGTPAPAIDFVREMTRWWDYWLKDIPNGVMEEPKATFYVQDVLDPAPYVPERPGAWMQASTFPPAENERLTLTLSEGKLDASGSELMQSVTVLSPVTVGTQQGEYCPIFGGAEGHSDQRPDDALSIFFETSVLEQSIVLVGSVVLDLQVSISQSSAQLVAKLSSVAPDGQTTLLTYGAALLKRLTRAVSVVDVEGETSLGLTLSLDDVGVRVPEGHKLRLSFATGSFPLLWPNKDRGAVTLCPGRQHIHLPVFGGYKVESPFLPAPAPADVAIMCERAPSYQRTIAQDAASSRVTVDVHSDSGVFFFSDHGLRTEHVCQERYTALPEDSLSVDAQVDCSNRVRRDGWSTETTTRMEVKADAHNFIVDVSQSAQLDGETMHVRSWQRRIPRINV